MGRSRSRSIALMCTESEVAAVNGAMPSGVGSSPITRWPMIGLATIARLWIVSVDARPPRRASSSISSRRADRTSWVSSPRPPFWVHHHVADPTHEVLAETDLWVHQAVRCQHVAGAEIDEMPGDRGGPNVDGDAVECVDDLLNAADHTVLFRLGSRWGCARVSGALANWGFVTHRIPRNEQHQHRGAVDQQGCTVVPEGSVQERQYGGIEGQVPVATTVRPGRPQQFGCVAGPSRSGSAVSTNAMGCGGSIRMADLVRSTPYG